MKLDLTYTPQQDEIFFQTEDHKFIVIPKGRRFGATQGAMHASMEWAISGEPVLWGDTINSNIDRYFERYGKPAIKDIPHSYSAQQKKLTFPFSRGFIDFRSADRPENWEGFGYKRIILNEAGIILKNDYLYTNAVLPMMMDFADSRLYALGVPKGRIKKDGREHKFYTLYLNAKNGIKGYYHKTFSSYDNPLLNAEDIKSLEDEISRMDPAMVKQEIYGEFIEEIRDALWQPEMIKRVDEKPSMIRRVLGVDPSATKAGDEVGIVAAGKTDKGFCVYADLSGNYSPAQWGSVVANAIKIHDIDAVVLETNQGGEMAENIIRQFDKHIRIIKIHAVKSKQVRAEPVVSLYERDKVRHFGGLHKLENEMLTWIPGQGKSPNRIDAAVYTILELMSEKDKSDLGNLKGVFY